MRKLVSLVGYPNGFHFYHPLSIPRVLLEVQNIHTGNENTESIKL